MGRFLAFLSNVFDGGRTILAPPVSIKAMQEAWQQQRVGVNSLEPYPKASRERLFQWSRECDLAYSCIQKIVEAAQDPDLIIQYRSERGAEWRTDYGHPLRRLLMRPNPEMTQADFLGAWLASECVTGFFAAEIARTKRSRKPAELWPLDPTRLHLTNAGWVWRDGAQETDFNGGADLFLSILPDPQRPWLPLAPLSVALGAAQADALQSGFVRAFFRNSGVPSGILKIKGRTLKDEQAEEIRKRWLRRHGAGGRVEGGPAVLDDNAEYQKIGANVSEIESVNLTEQNESRICGVFGVPPLLVSALVGLKNVNQRASAIESQRDFWANKMSPLFKRLRSRLQWSLLLEFEPTEEVLAENVRVFWDMSSVVAMQEEIGQRDTRARESFRAGALTLNEYRAIMGLPVVKGGDYYLRRANAIPITSDVVAAQTEAAAAAAGRAVSLVLTGESQPDLSDELGEAGEKMAGGFANVLKGRRLRWAMGEKTYDWDGAICWREPTEIERRLDVKANALMMDWGKLEIFGRLVDARALLIVQALEKLATLELQQLHELILTFPVINLRLLSDEVSGLALKGRELADAEMRLLKGKDFVNSLADLSEGELGRIVNASVVRLLNDTQARATSLAAHFGLSIGDRAEWLAQIEQGLQAASLVSVSRAAAEAANAAISLGRKAALSKGSRFVYSSVLDSETCKKKDQDDSCESFDGLEADRIDELPDAPNPYCGQGYGACRCLIVPID